MILAAILRNFKCYKGINIIPFSSGNLDSMNIIIGDNGVGKSAILEGLDTLFNESQWIVNNESNKTDVSVGAVMLVEKYLVNRVLDKNDGLLLAEISDFFWSVEESNTTLKQYSKFFELRNSVAKHKAEFYFFVVGREYEKKDLLFLTFTSLLRNSFSSGSKVSNQDLSKLLAKVLSLYSYIYIPVETSISDFVKLQNKSMQSLMDSSVRDRIAEGLNRKRVGRDNGYGKRKVLSLLEMINELLEQYVNGVEADIQRVYSGYSYKPGPWQSSKLTANHVVDTIVSAYYSKRLFKKDGKEIQFLSSGEKRLILIDIISAFVKKENASHELIIAVDEPENSLHISKCYDQFQKIEDIALKYNHQLFVTTHWYGSLPCLSRGSLIHIDNSYKPEVTDLYNYFEKRGTLPDDIFLKGFFDLSSSLLYAFRGSDKNWLLVEGYDDKKYIEYHLSRSDLRIIPLGGCGNVRKVYEHLYAPVSSKDFQYSEKRILCIIDTDAVCPSLGGIGSGTSNKVLMIRRFNEMENGDIALVDIDMPSRKETEIEDVLDPRQFYEALKSAITEYGSVEEQKAFSSFIFDETANHSRIKGDDSILKLNDLTRNAKDDKQTIVSFIDSHKDIVANFYTTKPYSGVPLPWVLKLNALLV